MKLLKPEQVVPGVYQLWGVGAKVTVIADGNDVIMIDAGGLGSQKLLSYGLNELGYSLEQISLVAITHYHPDHTGGLSSLIEASSAKVAAHRLEADMFIRKKPFPSPFQNPTVARIAKPVLEPLYGTPIRVDHPLENGDVLPVSENIRVIHTPGHTQGSICLYVVSKRMIIVGDALQYRFRKLGLPAAPVTWNMGQALESAKKLLDIDFETIIFSHFPPLQTGVKDKLRRMVDRASVDMRYL